MDLLHRLRHGEVTATVTDPTPLFDNEFTFQGLGELNQLCKVKLYVSLLFQS